MYRNRKYHIVNHPICVKMSELDNDIKNHLVKTFLDIIVLTMLSQNSSHGYALIADIHKKFDVLLSPGTLYPLLYSLEKKDMVSIKKDGRRKNYFLTSKGKIQSQKVIQLYKQQISQLLHFLD